MTHLATLLATFAWCAASAVVPVVNAELYLLAAAAVAPPALLLPLVVVATIGQMMGKTVMYLAARGALTLKHDKLRRTLAAVEARYKDRAALGDVVLLTSAATGFPPFYLVSVAAGVLRVPLARFLVLGSIGRFARFAVIVYAPQLVRGWWGW